MARKISGRETALIVLLGALGLFALYYGRSPRVAGDDDVSSLGELKIVDPPRIHMALLDQGAVPYDSEGRSLFKYYTPPPPKRAAPPPPPPAPPRPERKTPPPQSPKPSRRTGPVPPSPSFSYLGYLGPKDDKLAVFEDEQGMLLARAGEVVRDHFVVLDFKYEGVVMGFTDERFKGQTTELEQLGVDSRGGKRGRR